MSRVFISYSHRDLIWVERLVRHLNVLEKLDLLQVWVDRKIPPGSEWRDEIQQAMETANVAVLMISADFLSSDFILGKEIPRLLKRRQEENLKIFPVILRESAWELVPWLAPLQVWPYDGRPLAARRGNGIDTELALLAREILRVVHGASTPERS